MDKMEGLRAGVAEMRSVARRLNQWADDMEASFQAKAPAPPEAGESRTTASGGNLVRDEVIRNERAVRGTVATIEDAGVPGAGSAGKKKKTADKAHAEPAAVEKALAPAPLTLPDVRAVLAGKCATGFSTQVKALIESYGVSSLRDVPAEKYEELLEAVKALGDKNAG